MASSGSDQELRVEDLEVLRTDLEQVKTEQAQVTKRKQELVQAVKDRIASLQKLLALHGEQPVLVTAPRVVASKDATPLIEYVRRELVAAGRELPTPIIRQALISRHGVSPERLKNLSQILYKSSSVYKAGGKIGLVEWKTTPKVKAPVAKKSLVKSSHMSPEKRQEAAERMKAFWAKKRAAAKKAAKA